MMCKLLGKRALELRNGVACDVDDNMICKTKNIQNYFKRPRTFLLGIQYCSVYVMLEFLSQIVQNISCTQFNKIILNHIHSFH